MTDRWQQQAKAQYHANQSRYIDYLDGVTGKLDPDTGIPLSNASQGLTAGWTWVQLAGQREGAAVLNSAVNPYSPGIPVETAIDRKTNKRFITSIHWEEAVRIFGEDTARRMATPTPQAVESDALTLGKVEPGSGLTIYVRRFVHDLTEFPGAYYDLTSLISGMSADSQEMVIVGVDETTNAITVTEGAEKSLAYTFQQADADAIALATGVVPLAALVLRDDQTDSTDSFVPYKRFFDRRQFLNIASGAGYVVLDPASDTRNVIQPTGDFYTFTLKNDAAQTKAPFRVTSDADVLLASITAAGGITGTSLAIESAVGGTLVSAIGDGGASNGVYTSYNAVTAATSTQLTMARARGSLGTPAAIATNDRMGQILFQGYDGDQFINGVTILASVADTVSDNSMPSRLIFNLIRAAGDTALTEYLRFQGGALIVNEGSADLDFRIETDGNANAFVVDGGLNWISMFTATPTAPLDINADLLRLRTSKTPSSATDTAVGRGLICTDSDYIYISTGSNAWKRVAIATW